MKLDFDGEFVDRLKTYGMMSVSEYNRVLMEIIDATCCDLSEEDCHRALAPAFKQLWKVLGAKIVSQVKIDEPDNLKEVDAVNNVLHERNLNNE